MNSLNEQLANHKIAHSRTMLWVITIVLLMLVVNNVKSNEIPSGITHHQIEISGFAFIPKQLNVSIGDTITWTNKDVVSHNIFDSTLQKRISPDLATGETFTWVVKNSMSYKCEPHPSMKGSISLIGFP